MPNSGPAQLILRPHAGVLETPAGAFPCVWGRGGIKVEKREGDGATPAGIWAVVRVLFRPDRESRPETALPVAPISPQDGWCDDPGDVAYNCPVTLPYPAGHETLWREDGLYDLVAVLDHNQNPPRPGLGSAIFLHVAAPNRTPTAGCLALAASDLRRVLAVCGPGTRVTIPTPE